MKVEFNIGNRHLLVFVVTAVVVIGLSTGFAEPPNPGHGWEQIEIPAGVWTGLWAEKADTAGSADYATSAGSADTAQTFVDLPDTLDSDGNDIIDWADKGGVECINKRSDIMNVYYNDAILWCTSDYPNLVHCSTVNDQAPDSSPTTEAGTPELANCLSDGYCDARGIRVGPGADNQELEIVQKSGGIQGCWAYENDHTHADYRIEIVCCK